MILIVVLGSVSAYRVKHKEKITDVSLGKVQKQKLTSIVSASGNIQPKKRVEISASIPGKVIRLAVEEGDMVKKDQLLLQIDPVPYQAAVANADAVLRAARSELESAAASLKQADQTFRRKERMRRDEGLISEEEYERSKTDYEVEIARKKSAEHQVARAQADLESARDNLNKTVVTAPMAGTIVQLAVEEGEVAVIGTMNNPGTVLMTVADLSVMEAELEVDETDIAFLKLGLKSMITVDAFPGKKFWGSVTKIGNSPIEKGTGTNQEATDFKVTVTLDNPGVSLRPGLTADGEITTAVRENCLTVPIQALVVRDITKGDKTKSNLPKDQREKEGVFVKKNDIAMFRPVTTGIMGEMNIEVVQGLSEGLEIVTGSYQTLRELKDGDKIRLAKEEKKEEEKK